jgi:hypothetical protein
MNELEKGTEQEQVVSRQGRTFVLAVACRAAAVHTQGHTGQP